MDNFETEDEIWFVFPLKSSRTIYVRNGMDAGTTLCAIVRECAQADFHKDYTLSLIHISG